MVSLQGVDQKCELGTENLVSQALALARAHVGDMGVSALTYRNFGGRCTDALIIMDDGTSFSFFTPVTVDEFREMARLCGFPQTSDDSRRSRSA